MSTSASDNERYPAFCALAAADDVVFATFRQSTVYREILEHFDYEQGVHYLCEIKTENPSLLDHIAAFKTGDRHGGPTLYRYDEIGEISPSTLYYIRQLSHLVQYFGDLAGKHIVEIGCGYGGLAKVVLDRFDVASYTVFDLVPVLALTRKFLSKCRADHLERVRFCELGSYVPGARYDLLVSNCAFTECVPAIQDAYLDALFAYSNSGFLLYNQRVESYHPSILLSKIERHTRFRVGFMPLEPPSRTEYIVAWNTKRELRPLPYKRRFVYRFSPRLYHVSIKLYRRLAGR